MVDIFYISNFQATVLILQISWCKARKSYVHKPSLNSYIALNVQTLAFLPLKNDTELVFSTMLINCVRFKAQGALTVVKLE